MLQNSFDIVISTILWYCHQHNIEINQRGWIFICSDFFFVGPSRRQTYLFTIRLNLNTLFWGSQFYWKFWIYAAKLHAGNIGSACHEQNFPIYHMNIPISALLLWLMMQYEQAPKAGECASWTNAYKSIRSIWSIRSMLMLTSIVLVMNGSVEECQAGRVFLILSIFSSERSSPPAFVLLRPSYLKHQERGTTFYPCWYFYLISLFNKGTWI